MGSAQSHPPSAELDAKLAFLKQPNAYAERPRAVKAVETHMSWVFLTDGAAYKLKKPVRYPFLDFSTCEARRRNCEEELRLNRRLAPDVYQNVVALVRRDDGALALAGRGEVVDWLVKMRRLPDARMLDALIRAGSVTAEDIHALGETLAGFYLRAERVAVEPEAYRARLASEVRANIEALYAPAYGLSGSILDRVLAGQSACLERHGELFERRAREGRIVEGHGDLRPEHVCLEAEPVVIDCLEFNRDFRLIDPADELAFLALECERLGNTDVGRGVFEVYCDRTGDHPEPRLVNFYKSYRAALRAKLAAWHLGDPTVGDMQHWRSVAADYLQLAQEYAIQAGSPV